MPRTSPVFIMSLEGWLRPARPFGGVGARCGIPPPPVKGKGLRDAIARKRDELRAIEHRRDAAERELRRLEAEFAIFDAPHPETPGEFSGSGDSVPATAAGKVALFRALFRGREDVFPVLWTNRRTGRTGYAPACGNAVDTGGLRKAARTLRGVSEPSVSPGSRPRDPGPPSGTPRGRRLPHAP